MVKKALAMAVILGCGVLAAGPACAHAANSASPAAASQPTESQASGQGQQQQTPAPQQAPKQTQQQTPQAGQSGSGAGSSSGSGSNPFPEDETTVPVMPAKETPDVPEGNTKSAPDLGAVFPAGDMDPVRSPDASGGNEGTDQGFSSSSNGVDSLLPPPDANTGKKHGKSGDEDMATIHHENAAEDENVGGYYLESKNWRAALSRFESALVLDPDNPDVYWGLAESQRHLGNFADARTNYLKVMEYDPDSRHAKDAKKALAEPELANAKSAQGQGQAGNPRQ